LKTTQNFSLWVVNWLAAGLTASLSSIGIGDEIKFFWGSLEGIVAKKTGRSPLFSGQVSKLCMIVLMSSVTKLTPRV